MTSDNISSSQSGMLSASLIRGAGIVKIPGERSTMGDCGSISPGVRAETVESFLATGSGVGVGVGVSSDTWAGAVVGTGVRLRNRETIAAPAERAVSGCAR